jgi:mono/diheme cytochrome c family protein
MEAGTPTTDGTLMVAGTFDRQSGPAVAGGAQQATDVDSSAMGTEGPEPMAVLFAEKCYSCHTIGGGDKTGPDLKGVTSSRDSDWLARFIQRPRAVYRTGDATAVDLFRRFSPDVMPDQALTEAEIGELMAFVAAVSVSGKLFVPPGGGLSRAIMPEDIPAGRNIFAGKTVLSAGAPSCISCHTVSELGGFGGGTLGPDLTKSNVVYSEAELVNILRNPAFPTMAAMFVTRPLDDEEVVQVYAYLNSVRDEEPAGAGHYFLFTAVGMGLSLAILFVMGVLWRSRLHGVRRPMVEQAARKIREGDRP